jgi:hypothetical protein
MCECSDEKAPALRQRARAVEIVSLSLFLVLIGVLEAIPGSQWALFGIGAGAILLGRAQAQHAYGLTVRPLGLILGAGALVAGVAGAVSPGLPLLPAFLVAGGVAGLGVAARLPRPR